MHASDAAGFYRHFSTGDERGVDQSSLNPSGVVSHRTAPCATIYVTVTVECGWKLGLQSDNLRY